MVTRQSGPSPRVATFFWFRPDSVRYKYTKLGRLRAPGYRKRYADRLKYPGSKSPMVRYCGSRGVRRRIGKIRECQSPELTADRRRASARGESALPSVDTAHHPLDAKSDEPA